MSNHAEIDAVNHKDTTTQGSAYGTSSERLGGLNHKDTGTQDRSFELLGDRVNRLAAIVVEAAIEVHRHIGPGFIESLYEEALSVELTMRGVPHLRQVTLPIAYKGHGIGEGRVDLLVDQKLVVELKAVEAIANVHLIQVRSYLKATHLQLGLLINFNVPLLLRGVRRVILTERHREESETKLSP